MAGSESGDGSPSSGGVAAAKAVSSAMVLLMLFDVLTGTSVFGLPSAMHTSGWLVFILAQLLFASLSAATSLYLLQTMQVNARKPQSTSRDLQHGGQDGPKHEKDGEAKHSKWSQKRVTDEEDREEDESSRLMSSKKGAGS